MNKKVFDIFDSSESLCRNALYLRFLLFKANYGGMKVNLNDENKVFTFICEIKVKFKEIYNLFF